MSRLIKKAVFFNAVQDRTFYYEIYKNPTQGDLNKIKKGDPSALSFRGIMTFDGTVYVWSGNLLHKDAINQGGLPEGLHFDFDGSDLDLYIVPGIVPEDLYDIIERSKSNLSSLNINDSVGIMINTKYYGAQRYPLYDEIKYFGDIFTKVPSLAKNNHNSITKTAEFFNADKITHRYVEVFKNPTMGERETACESYGDMRGIISFNTNDLYIWQGNVLHEAVLGSTNLNVPDGIHISTDGPGRLEIYILPKLTPELLRDMFTAAKSKLDKIGLIGSTQIVYFSTTFYGAKHYPEYDTIKTIDDIYNLKIEVTAIRKDMRLKKSAKFFNADQIGLNYTEVFINPTSAEVNKLKSVDGSYRGVIDFTSYNIYAWRGETLHDKVLKNESLNIPDGIRFVTDGSIIGFSLLPQITPQILQDILLAAKSHLSNMGINGSVSIFEIDVNYYGAQYYPVYDTLKTINDIYNMKVEVNAYMKNKRLIKKAKFYSADNIYGDYVEVFKNPTKSETFEINKINGMLRGIIDFNEYNVYLWRGDIEHSNVLHSDELSVPDGLHFALDKSGIYMYLGTRFYPQLIQEMIEKSKDKLALVGINNSTKIDGIDTYYYGADKYSIYDKYKTIEDILTMDPDADYDEENKEDEDNNEFIFLDEEDNKEKSYAFKNNKRLVKKSKFWSADNVWGNYIEIFKNPTTSEANNIKEIEKSDGSIRGIIDLETYDVYAWRGDILHSNILNHKEFNVPNGLHIVYDDGSGLYLYLSSAIDPEILQETLVSAKSKLANIGVTESTKIDGIDTNYYGATDYHIYYKYDNVGDIFTMDPDMTNDYGEEDYDEEDYDEEEYDEEEEETKEKSYASYKDKRRKSN